MKTKTDDENQMTTEVWRMGRWLVRDFRCCGLLWQVVNGGLQKRFWNLWPECPRCQSQR
jgi:hypothetical protein